MKNADYGVIIRIFGEDFEHFEWSIWKTERLGIWFTAEDEDQSNRLISEKNRSDQ